MVVHVFGCYFLCLRCPSNTSAVTWQYMCMFRHIYVNIIKLSNWASVLACGCLWSVVLFSLPFQS